MKSRGTAIGDAKQDAGVSGVFLKSNVRVYGRVKEREIGELVLAFA